MIFGLDQISIFLGPGQDINSSLSVNSGQSLIFHSTMSLNKRKRPSEGAYSFDGSDSDDCMIIEESIYPLELLDQRGNVLTASDVDELEVLLTDKSMKLRVNEVKDGEKMATRIKWWDGNKRMHHAKLSMIFRHMRKRGSTLKDPSNEQKVEGLESSSSESESELDPEVITIAKFVQHNLANKNKSLINDLRGEIDDLKKQLSEEAKAHRDACVRSSHLETNHNLLLTVGWLEAHKDCIYHEFTGTQYSPSVIEGLLKKMDMRRRQIPQGLASSWTFEEDMILMNDTVAKHRLRITFSTGVFPPEIKQFSIQYSRYTDCYVKCKWGDGCGFCKMRQVKSNRDLPFCAVLAVNPQNYIRTTNMDSSLRQLLFDAPKESVLVRTDNTALFDLLTERVNQPDPMDVNRPPFQHVVVGFDITRMTRFLMLDLAPNPDKVLIDAFHGSGGAYLDSIVDDSGSIGFDPKFIAASAYGPGMYFALNSNYSLDDRYSRPDAYFCTSCKKATHGAQNCPGCTKAATRVKELLYVIVNSEKSKNIVYIDPKKPAVLPTYNVDDTLTTYQSQSNKNNSAGGYSESERIRFFMAGSTTGFVATKCVDKLLSVGILYVVKN